MSKFKYISLLLWIAAEMLYYSYYKEENKVNWYVFMNARNYYLVLVISIDGIFNEIDSIFKSTYLIVGFIMAVFLFVELNYINASWEKYAEGLQCRLISNAALISLITVLYFTSIRAWQKYSRTL